MPSYLNALGLLCALGEGKQAVADALLAGDASGMHAEDGWVTDRRLTVGAVRAVLPAMPAGFEAAHSRNNQLLLAAAQQIEPELRAAIARHGATRVGLVLGTSTSGIREASDGIARYLKEGELPADYDYAQQEMAAPATFLADWLGLAGPVYCQSTACTSSARALLSAHRLLQQGLCDAVICGGVDSLCRLTLNGFSALEAVSAEPCNPFSVNRHGINIGEGAALFLMTRESSPIAFLGGGASSDAHHISAPHPQGLGARAAMDKALASAGLQASDIDYLNLHGTATTHNDAMESHAVHGLFPATLPCSSTKPLTGHTLGAAGALEAAFCWLALSEYNRDGLLPPHRWDGQADPALAPLRLVGAGDRLQRTSGRRLMSNSFAFGGNNVALILGDAP
ncbi:beta-ketoacyl-[acyl-carrier-protein] synthase family protein [Aquipseudomonas alcaligenes]|uniref:3-oxoacyl-[acyl-carrier-protein] synthase n=1 Tax=Aquipseudomonas alcaligenes (strain ATCC 14909 / DSM 50342 / CCUG 1425 / JCM 20561 / NBRC 14159 / NCIMB 9945 / NCTC 10367 / 1577) TaxID=1215092 RepID=U2ZHX3_AQUA1|nr:beta-ketoacyl-[acyl-carrier-protein] synthase family protein [Pseudomonas alcaligenes]GAD60722.1 putative 3-oxoacyl-[acyl-carrier-protein] synthase [Pseudomonas alcaligenes NBRC 14159]SUD13757.1 3-oxoacyl-ACP synthase [Pseudomonas alcaligenes]